MELYKRLAELRCFTRNDMVQLSGSESAAEWQINSYLKKGYIERVRRNLYAVISLETGQPIPNRYQIASKITCDACVTHHSAFEYYGYANQVFYDVYFSTTKRTREFSYDGIYFHPIKLKGNTGIIETNTHIRVTSLERTVIDSIADFEKIGGLEELLRCLMLIPSLDSEKLLESLELYGHAQLYQKTGYILENFKFELALPDSFFEECKKHSSNSKTYLYSKQPDFVLNKNWKLFAPKDLKKIVSKGVSDYDAI